MKKLDHPMILKLNGVAQDKRVIYMFVEYMQCGDLMKVINKFTKLDPNHAKFYTA